MVLPPSASSIFALSSLHSTISLCSSMLKNCSGPSGPVELASIRQLADVADGIKVGFAVASCPAGGR